MVFNLCDIVLTWYIGCIPRAYQRARLVTWHKTFIVHIWTRRSPSLWLILKPLIAYFTITCSRDSSCILPIVERRRLVSERPSFVMRLFKRPACRETQASKITNIIFRQHRRFAILHHVQGKSFTSYAWLGIKHFYKIYKMSSIERAVSRFWHSRQNLI